MTFSHMSQQLLGNELRHHPQTGGGEKDELTDTDAQGYTIFFSSRFFKKKNIARSCSSNAVSYSKEHSVPCAPGCGYAKEVDVDCCTVRGEKGLRVNTRLYGLYHTRAAAQWGEKILKNQALASLQKVMMM